MNDEPTNPLIKKHAPKIGPHAPVTLQPEHHGVETPERSERRQRRFVRILKIGLPLLGILILMLFLIVLVAV